MAPKIEDKNNIFSPTERGVMVGQMMACHSQREVADFWGCAQSTVSRAWSKYHSKGSCDDYNRTGRPPRLTGSKKDDIKDILEENPYAKVADIKNELQVSER